MNLNKYLPEHHEKVKQILAHYEVTRLLIELELREGKLEKALNHMVNQRHDLELLLKLQQLKREKDRFSDFFHHLERELNQPIDWNQVRRAYNQ